MSSTLQTLLLWAVVLIPGSLFAHFSVPVAGRKVQVHSFASQGFAYSNTNNFLTMKTSDGSLAFTDGGVNASMQVTDSFRVGAQGYARNVGRLGQGHVELDVYGEIPLRTLGSLGYTAYYGARPNDPRGGYYYGASDAGAPVKTFSGRQAGVDLRWNTPLQGVLVGTSWMDQTVDASGVLRAAGNIPYQTVNDPKHTYSLYGDFQRGSWHFAGEYRLDNHFMKATIRGVESRSDWSEQGFFVSAAYRLLKRLEVGAYQSRFYIAAPHTPESTSRSGGTSRWRATSSAATVTPIPHTGSIPAITPASRIRRPT